MSSSKAETTPKRRSRRSKALRSPIVSESDREQALRDYKVTIEYKHLKQHSPSGVYVLPSLTSLRSFHGVIFLRRGLYSDAIFKFTIELPPEYNGVNSWPRIVFSTNVYNPHVCPESGELDVKSAYPDWDPHRHYLVTVLTFLKKIFYMKSFSENVVANIEARDLSRTDPVAYRRTVEKCARESLRCVHVNEPGCTVKFVEDNICHEILRIMMKETFKDPASISRTLLIDMVKGAQEQGREEIKLQAEKNEEEGSHEE
jgi:ubiquitin-protein ligase